MARIDSKLQAWIDARKRHHLSHAHVQMARELGLNPAKLGAIENHRQEPWKLPLPEFISHLYEKRFGKKRPDVVATIEERARASAAKAAARKAKKQTKGRTWAVAEGGQSDGPAFSIDPGSMVE